MVHLQRQLFVHSTLFRTWNDMRSEFLKRRIIKDKADYEIFVFHVFRHTCATNLASNLRVPVTTISEILGHKAIATTMKYAHAKPDHIIDVMK